MSSATQLGYDSSGAKKRAEAILPPEMGQPASENHSWSRATLALCLHCPATFSNLILTRRGALRSYFSGVDEGASDGAADCGSADSGAAVAGLPSESPTLKREKRRTEIFSPIFAMA